MHVFFTVELLHLTEFSLQNISITSQRDTWYIKAIYFLQYLMYQVSLWLVILIFCKENLVRCNHPTVKNTMSM